MKTLVPTLCCVLLLAGTLTAQITTITAGSLINPVVLDFDTGAPPPPGPITGSEAYFTNIGITGISIVNAPGIHTPGDSLSSGFVGNCLVAQSNTLAIAAPNGLMDNHQQGAGWSVQLASFATQFGCLVTDQTGHSMTVETWTLGSLQNTLTFTMASATGGFPNPHIYFEDLAGFDEIRFQNPVANGGWGIDDLTIAGFGYVPFDASIACNPAGGGVDFSVVNGTPGNSYYIATAAVFTGIAPNGSLLGIEITFAEIVAQIQTGLPFVGVIGAAGGNTFTFNIGGAPCGMLGIPLDYVGIEFTAGLTLFVQAGPAHTVML